MTAQTSTCQTFAPKSASREHPCTAVDTLSIMDVPVSAIDLVQAETIIDAWIDARARKYVCITGVHGIVESLTDPVLRSALARADLVTPDGMPLVWIAWLRGFSKVKRVYGPDLMRRLSAPGARSGRRHYYYGGGAGVSAMLSRKLTAANPDLVVVGHATPPFGTVSDAEEARALAAINAARPDILWVGLSTPKQDVWMYRCRDRLDVPVIIGVGAAFDFLSGLKKQAPSWLGAAGFEWLFRLCCEPKRLYRRYCFIVPVFCIVLTKEVWLKAHRRVLGCSKADVSWHFKLTFVSVINKGLQRIRKRV